MAVASDHRVRKLKDARGEFDLLYERTFLGVFSDESAVSADDDLLEYLVGGEPRAWVLVRKTGAEWYVVYGGVVPEYRGFGGKYLSRLFDVLGTMARTTVRLTTKSNNRAMQILALRMGFELSGIVMGRDGTMELMFARRL